MLAPLVHLAAIWSDHVSHARELIEWPAVERLGPPDDVGKLGGLVVPQEHRLLADVRSHRRELPIEPGRDVDCEVGRIVAIDDTIVRGGTVVRTPGQKLGWRPRPQGAKRRPNGSMGVGLLPWPRGCKASPEGLEGCRLVACGSPRRSSRG